MVTMRKITGLSLMLSLVACGSGSGRIAGVNSTLANVQVLNASTTAIDLLENQGASAGNSNIAFGAASQCKTVEIVSHGLSVRPTGVQTTSTLLPSFAANERYLVTVTGGTSALTVLSFRNSYTPASGDGGVRLINLSGSGSYDVYVTDPGAALGTAGATAVIAGAASPYFGVPAGTKQIRLTNNGATQVAFDVGNATITAGSRSVVVLAAPASGGTTLRTFVFQLSATNTTC
jgi:hypothetical protein